MKKSTANTNAVNVSVSWNTWSFGEQFAMASFFATEGMAVADKLNNKSETQITNYADRHGMQYIAPVKDAVKPKRSITRSRWTDEDDVVLKKMYPTTPAEEIRRHLSGNKSVSAIQNRASKCGIYKEGRGPLRNWSFEEYVIINAYYPTEGLDVAKRLKDRTPVAIAQYAAKCGIKSNTKKKWYITEAEKQIFIELRDKGAKYCANLTNRSLTTVYRWFKILDGVQRPAKHYNHWTDADIAFLCENYGKMPVAEIAKALGRSKQAIYSYVNKLNVTKKAIAA